MNSNNFENLVQKLQTNKLKLVQNKEELATIIKSFDIQFQPDSQSINITNELPF